MQKAAEWGNTMGQHYGSTIQYVLGLQISNRIAKKKQTFSVNQRVDAIQQIILESNTFKISWVKAHVGIQSNEDANVLEKNAALNENKEPKYYLPKPNSK